MLQLLYEFLFLKCFYAQKVTECALLTIFLCQSVAKLL